MNASELSTLTQLFYTLYMGNDDSIDLGGHQATMTGIPRAYKDGPRLHFIISTNEWSVYVKNITINDLLRKDRLSWEVEFQGLPDAFSRDMIYAKMALS
jgi:hypothetical protein